MPSRERDKHIRETAEHFDDQALRYDRSRTVRRFQSRVQALLLSQLDFRPGMRVLDLGCGTGTATLAIAPQLGESGEVVGVDASPKMIAEAERKRRRLGLTDASLPSDALRNWPSNRCLTSLSAPTRSITSGTRETSSGACSVRYAPGDVSRSRTSATTRARCESSIGLAGWVNGRTSAAPARWSSVS